jgi:CheY-like chemotaxis protein
MGARAETAILYVEDNQDHAELVMRCLDRRGLRGRVIHVEDGEQALAMLEDVKAHAAARPKLVLLDLKLPKVSGIEVLRQIKSTPELVDIPVIVFTTSANPRDIRDAYASYVNSYLVKPDDLATLDALLSDLSTYWLDHNCTLTS